jgi:hypothetical protein
MADAVVTTTEEIYGTVKKVKFAIVSATDGTATATTANAFSGEVLRLVIVPGAAGDAPTDQFDVAVNDADGYDILAGQGANLSNAATTTVVASMGCVANDRLSLSASGMGDQNTATAYVYIR